MRNERFFRGNEPFPLWIPVFPARYGAHFPVARPKFRGRESGKAGRKPFREELQKLDDKFVLISRTIVGKKPRFFRLRKNFDREKLSVSEEETNFHAEETENHSDSHTHAEAKPPKSDSEMENRVFALTARMEELERELEGAKAEVETAQKDRLYAQAELQNFRRRKEDEFASQQKFMGERLLKELLPIVDNFERGLAAAAAHKDYDKLIGGVQGTLKQLTAFLEKSGVTPIETVGKEFDTQYHEAIGVAEVSDLPPHTVAEELQRGYLIHDRVLRPALVKVSSE